MRSLSIMLTLVAFAGALSAQEENRSGVPIPPLPAFDKSDPAVYGRQIAEYTDLYNSGYVDEVQRGGMTLFDADGESVRRTFTRMTLEDFEGGDKIITKFLSPAEIKGVAALTHENPGSSDDNWLYLPANKRTRRISGANNTASFQGTEFTYEDLSNLDPSEYEWRFLDEDALEVDGTKVPVFKLQAKPTYADTGYSKLVVYIHRELWRGEKIEFYDKAGQHLKTRTSGDWEIVHGRFSRSLSVEMTNHQTGKRTALYVDMFFVDLSQYTSSRTGEKRKNLTADLFTTRALES